MGHLIQQRYSRAFALPVVMISSVVMMMVLLSGLTAASSVSVGLRSQYEDKILQSAAASGVAMAKDCIARNDNSITWTDARPLKPNTNCQGIEQFSCPTTSTEEKCYLSMVGTYRSKFSVSVSTSENGETTVNAEAILHQMRKTSNVVLKQYKQNKKATVNSDVSIASGVNSKLSGIVRGDGFACGIDISGKAWCWGANGYSQLGNGGTAMSLVPVAVSQGAMPAGVKVLSLTAGSLHACATASNGLIYCWGYGADGRLGNGLTANVSTPAAVSQGTIPAGAIRDISAGNSHTCVVASNGKAYCWGLNSNGQLGNNSTASSPNPVEVVNAAGLANISTGISHSCAITTAGAALCWGFNGNGQLGNGTTNQSLVPVGVSQGAIPTSTTLRAISANSASTTCVLGYDNKAYCWGRNDVGQLGNNTISSQSNIPVAVAQGNIGLPTTVVIQDIAVGHWHSCVSTSSGKAYCWGRNESGQFGNGTTTNSAVPTEASLGTNVIHDIAVGSGGTCVVRSDAVVMCWGVNGAGQIGNNSTANSSVPVGVSVGASQMPLGVREIAIGGMWDINTACAITVQNKMYCWGSNSNGQFGNSNSAATSTPINAFTGGPAVAVKSVSVGSVSACVTTTLDTRCMGYNGYGQLGNGSTNDTGTPTVVSQGARPEGVSFISTKTKGFVSCAAGTDAKAYCWGRNDYGQLGNGSTANSTSPVAVSQGAVPSGVAVKDTAPYGDNSCLLGSNSKVYCWGYNAHGQLGNGSTANSTSPVAVSQGAIPSGVDAKAVEGNCIFGTDSWIYCWGWNGAGRFGNGSTANSTSPVAVSQGAIPSGVKIKLMSAGDGDHRCAVGTDNKVYCWGSNTAGQLGNGSTTNALTPVAVSPGVMPAGVTIHSIATGPASTCAAASDARVYCWGNNALGMLGNGNTTNSSVPVAVLQKLTFRGSGSNVGASLNNNSLLFTY